MRRWRNSRQLAGNSVAAILIVVFLVTLFELRFGPANSWQQALSYARTHRVVTTHQLALDEWQSFDTIQMSSFERQMVIAHTYGYNLLYVELNPPVGAAAQNTYANQLSSFITALGQQGIQVGALGGDPSWAQPAQYGYALQLLAFTTAYNETHQAQLAALQYDVEPYQGGSVSASAQQLTKLVAVLNRAPRAVPVGYSIPFWMVPAQCDTAQCPGFTLLQTIAEQPNSFVDTMAYRSTPYGSNGSIALSQPILTAAQRLRGHIDVYIGQDISKGPPAVSFYHSGNLSLAAALYVLDRTFSPQEDFSGSIVNDGQYALKGLGQ